VFLVVLILVVLNALITESLVSNTVVSLVLIVCGAALLFGLAFLSRSIVAWSWRTQHQICPDCLSDMTRGAKVCPFCGFRPAGPTISA
jgi:hypothetical protein